MHTDSPINPDLYSRLLQLYGHVEIVRPGEAAVPVRTSTYYDGREHVSYRLAVKGEEYRINCPICLRQNTPDTRMRCHINHRWGHGFPELGSDDKMWNAWYCFNEQCQSELANRKALRDDVFGNIGPVNRMRLTPSVMAASAARQEIVEVSLPGVCIPLSDLSDAHPANVYMASRFTDHRRISAAHELMLCESVVNPRHALAVNRIVIPVRFRGQLVGWQARYIGETDWGRLPKYFTMPDMPRRRLLYNFDAASRHPVVFLQEGPTDVWAVGDAAVCSFGSTLSSEHQALIVSTWQGVVLMWDADASEKAHAVQMMLNGKIPTVNVQLPDGVDPAQADSEFLWDLVYGSISQQQSQLLPLLATNA